MRGGGRVGGGGGRPQPHAAGEGSEIPQDWRKLVQELKGILPDRTEAEIYAALLQCDMDPDIAIERLISQDPFHEVRRKRNNKKEVKAPQETRYQPFLKSAYRESKTGSDRSGRVYSGLGDSTASPKGPIKKEPELLSTTASDSTKAGNPMEKKSSTGNVADVKSDTLQPPTQPQHGWGGVPGRPSMADIVKMGRAHAKSGSRSVGNSAGVPVVGDPIVSSATKTTLKDSQNTVLPSEAGLTMADKLPNETIQVDSVPKDDSSVDILPPGEGLNLLDSFGAASTNANPPKSFTPDVNEDDIGNDNYLEEIEEMNANNANVLSSSGPVSVSDKNIPFNNELIVQTDDYQSDERSFEGHKNSKADMSTNVYQIIKKAIHEETKSKAEYKPAVILPGHLQVSNDFGHLTFGNFVSGTLDTSCSTKPANSDGEVESASDSHSSDQSDVRSHGDKETITHEANEYIASATNSNMENPTITPLHQSEVARADLMDVTNSTEYNLSSQSDYAKSSAGQPESAAQAYLQENRQMQNISPLSSFMQANMQNGLLPPAMPPFRELDPAISLLLTNPPLATMIHGMTMTPSSLGNTTVPTQTQENVSQGGLSNPQLAHSQASTGIAPGPPLPHHLTLHPYAQPALPLGYANMIGYPSLAQSYAYLTPAAYQQPYMNTGIYHQPAAAPPNPSIKYPMPQYKTNVPLASLSQPASLSSYVGGFGTANGIPGNYGLNQSAASSGPTLGFDGTMPMQYKDANHYISLPQNENPPMWMHGAGSRAMPPITANTLYGYQGQQGHQGGIRHGQQLPSQFGAALGQSQVGLGPEHPNPSDSNLSAGQANQMWPNSY